MKNVILSLALITASLSATAPPKATVLLKSSYGIGFASPEVMGVYATQIEADGTIRYIDNKQRERVVAKLSSTSVNELKKQIAAVKAGTIVLPDEPQCMDAPSTYVKVYKADGSEVEIAEESGCLLGKLAGAEQLNSIADAMMTLKNNLAPTK
jgi:hypothetical protein